MDQKEVYQEAYDEAIEDGLSTSAAEAVAEEARVDFISSLTDNAMDRLKEDPKLQAEVEERVKSLDMGGGVYSGDHT